MLAGVVNRHDVRMVHFGRSPGLAPETLNRLSGCKRFGPQHFEGDLAIQLRVVGR